MSRFIDNKKTIRNEVRQFVPRSKALTRLGVDLETFRKLCIFKGIYPHEPKSYKGFQFGADQIYYLRKDIAYLSHEPLIRKFHEIDCLVNKVKRLINKGMAKDAERQADNIPSYSLDKIVKERYPDFESALADLDDALTMLFMFRTLDTDVIDTKKVHAVDKNINPKYKKLTQTIRSLTTEFSLFVQEKKLLKKAFISVKGFYFQAEINNVTITYIVPHAVSMHVPTFVDLSIMENFVEFYATLLKFVNYRLYNKEGFAYPVQTIDPVTGSRYTSFTEISPKRKVNLDEFITNALAAPEDAMDHTGETTMDQADNGSQPPSQSSSEQLSTLKEKATHVNEHMQAIAERDASAMEQAAGSSYESKTDAPEADDSLKESSEAFPGQLEGGDEVVTLQDLPTGQQNPELFKGLVFFISRETNFEIMEFLIRSYSGRVASDILHSKKVSVGPNDPSITHHIIDRPTVNIDRFPARIFVQPQYVFDCANKGELLAPFAYAPGAVLPAHFSPFFDAPDFADKEGDLDLDNEDDKKKKVLDDQQVYIEDKALEAAGMTQSQVDQSKLEAQEENKFEKAINKIDAAAQKIKDEHTLKSSILSSRKRKLYMKLTENEVKDAKERAYLKQAKKAVDAKKQH